MDTDPTVARAQAGDGCALAELIETHQTQIYSLTLAIMRNPADAANRTWHDCCESTISVRRPCSLR